MWAALRQRSEGRLLPVLTSTWQRGAKWKSKAGDADEAKKVKQAQKREKRRAANLACRAWTKVDTNLFGQGDGRPSRQGGRHRGEYDQWRAVMRGQRARKAKRVDQKVHGHSHRHQDDSFHYVGFEEWHSTGPGHPGWAREPSAEELLQMLLREMRGSDAFFMHSFAWMDSDFRQRLGPDPFQRQRSRQRQQQSSSPGAGTALQRHLQVLGVPASTRLNAASLRDAFLKCARQWHPDLHPAAAKPAAEARFKSVHESYQYLQMHVGTA